MAVTDDDKALVERLRSHDYDHAYNLKTDEELYAERDEAADLIETQAREIERLRGALTAVYNEGDFASVRIATLALGAAYD